MDRKRQWFAAGLMVAAAGLAPAVVLDDFNDGGTGGWAGVTPTNSWAPVVAGSVLSNVNNALRMTDPGFTNGMTTSYVGALSAGVTVISADARVVTDNGSVGNNCRLAAKGGGFFTAPGQGTASAAYARTDVDDSNSAFRKVAVAVTNEVPTDLTLLTSADVSDLASASGTMVLELDNVRAVSVTGTPATLDNFNDGSTSGWAGATEANAPFVGSAFSTVASTGTSLRLIDIGGGRAGWVKNYPGRLTEAGVYVVTADVRINSAQGNVIDLRMGVAPGLQVGVDHQGWPFSLAANLATGATITVPTPFRTVAAAIAVGAPGDLAVYFAQDLDEDFVTSYSYTACELEIDNVQLWGPIADGPSGPDLDNDGIPDAFEHAEPNPTQTSLYFDDTDRDGLLDGREDTNANGVRDAGETNARARDSDGDLLTDGIERFIGSDPLSNTSPGSFTDADNDWLPATHDPDDSRADSDGDRYRDGYEVVLLGIDAVGDPNRHPTAGDCNGDTFVTSLDALISQSFFLQRIDHTNPVFGGAFRGFRNIDLNANGYSDNLDSLIIQSYFLLIVPALPF